MHEVATWGIAIASLIGFGLAMGLNPALYAATADMLARNVNTGARLSWMVGGLAVGATLLLVIFHSFDPTSLVAASKSKIDAVLVNRAVDLLTGIVFLISAGVVWRWKVRVPALPAKPEKVPKEHARSFSFFFLGFGACIGFTTLPIMYLTGRLITTLNPDLAIRAGAYGIFLVALAAPFFTLAWLWFRVPALTHRVTGFYANAAGWDYRRALGVLLALAGLVFLALAIFAHRGQ